MSLLHEAMEASQVKRGCAISRLDDDLRAEIEEALAAPGVTGAGLERALARRGVNVKALTLRRHHNGDCSCEPG